MIVPMARVCVLPALLRLAPAIPVAREAKESVKNADEAGTDRGRVDRRAPLPAEEETKR
jgi:hypothetical protein